MDIFALYATDEKAEQDGKEFDMGGGVKMLIARSYNPTFVRMLNKQFDAHKHTLELKESDADRAAAEACSNKIMAHVMAYSVLLGWTGPVMYQGEPMPYNKVNAEKLLMLKEFQKVINLKAEDYRNFRVVTEDADVKNSLPTSSGTSPGAEASPSLSV